LKALLVKGCIKINLILSTIYGEVVSLFIFVLFLPYD
jgi:hypothetical protein